MKLLNLADLLTQLPEPVYARRYLDAFLAEAAEHCTCLAGAEQRLVVAGETLTFPSHVILDEPRFTRWHDATVKKLPLVVNERRVLKADELLALSGMSEAVFRHLAAKQQAPEVEPEPVKERKAATPVRPPRPEAKPIPAAPANPDTPDVPPFTGHQTTPPQDIPTA